MNSLDCAVLAFKLLGVWFAAQGVVGLGDAAYLQEQVRVIGAFGIAFRTALSVGVGALLWSNAGTIGARIFEDPSVMAARVFGDGAAPQPSPDGRVQGHPVFAVALAVIGVLMVTEAAPTIMYGIAMFIRSRRTGSILGPDPNEQAAIWDAANQANLASACVRLLIGLALFLGPARLASAYAGIRKELRSTLDEGPTQPS